MWLESDRWTGLMGNVRARRTKKRTKWSQLPLDWQRAYNGALTVTLLYILTISHTCPLLVSVYPLPILPASSAPWEVKPFRNDGFILPSDIFGASSLHVPIARNLVVVVAIVDPFILTLCLPLILPTIISRSIRIEKPRMTGGRRRDASSYSSLPLATRYSHLAPPVVRPECPVVAILVADRRLRMYPR